MRILALAISLIVSGTAVATEPQCSAAQQTPLTLNGWTPYEFNGRVDALGFGFSSTLTKEIVMLNAELWLLDPLDVVIGLGPITINPDQSIGSLGSSMQLEEFFAPTPSPYNRLNNIETDQVTAFICTSSVMYEDRTIETFD